MDPFCYSDFVLSMLCCLVCSLQPFDHLVQEVASWFIRCDVFLCFVTYSYVVPYDCIDSLSVPSSHSKGCYRRVLTTKPSLEKMGLCILLYFYSHLRVGKNPPKRMV